MVNSKELWASICAVGASAVFLAASFWNTDAEVYLFPRIVAILMVILSGFQIAGYLAERRSGDQSINIPWAGLLPGLLVVIAFVLVIETTGFYLGSFVAFIALVSIYGKRALLDPRALMYKVLVGVLLMGVLYGLFWKLLYVRTPTGWFI